MELRHLRSFVAVANEGHFGRAALALNIVQPALSRTIRALEQELGVVLFDRLPSGVRLTDAGRQYLREVERILADVSAASRLARSAADVEQKVTTVGYSMVLKSQEDILGNILERFSKAHPKYIVNLRFLSTFEQQNAIRERTVDAGFGHLCGPPMEGLRSIRIEEDPFCAARVGIGHRTAGRKRISVSDLKDDPLLIFRRARNPQMFDYVVERLQTSGFKGEIIQNADFSFWNWKVELMSRNTGWILSNRSSLKAAMAGTVCLPLSNFELPFGIDFICREDDDSKPVKALLSSIGASQRKSG
jgi:DNA-binding transcriptional LysR family regulator